MIKLYELLPDFYESRDKEYGYPLRDFLEPLQAKLEELHQDEKVLRLVQDPLVCRKDFLDWISHSLGWEFMASEEGHRRREALEIINFHDLKGTPYAMRLLSHVCFGDIFDRMYEFYPGTGHSISTIRHPYKNMDSYFKAMLEGGGTFADSDWRAAAVAERGRPYAFNKHKRLYEYCVYLRVLPDEYVRGTVRPQFVRFIKNYLKFHPAGRYCYVYITMPFFHEDDETQGDYLLEELTGTVHWDSHWRLDEGQRFDVGPGPVHPSLSYRKWVEWKKLDKDPPRHYDDGWHWDETKASAHAIIELK